MPLDAGKLLKKVRDSKLYGKTEYTILLPVGVAAIPMIPKRSVCPLIFLLMTLTSWTKLLFHHWKAHMLPVHGLERSKA
jgi:hypothetical protein